MILLIVGIAILGGAVAMLAYSGGEYYWRGLDYIERDFREKLKRLRVSTKRLRAYMVAWSIGVAAILLGFWLLLNTLIFGILFASLLVGVPWYVLRRMAEKRKEKIEDQLADAMVSLASAIKAGLSLGQSLEILAKQCPRPISEEFSQIVGEYQLGKPLERCLDEARDRLRSENFALFAAALQASRESGGRLNETVERIAHSVMELQRLERKIISETAQARTSALYMAMAPAAILALYYFFIDQANTERLFTTVAGQVILSMSVILNVLAYLWARAILNADI